MKHLTLYLDGVPRTEGKLISLARLLGRADPLPGFADIRPFAALLGSFGLFFVPDVDLPLAALTRQGTGEAADGLWLYADPVHQQADQDKVYLLGQAELSTEENAEALRTLNQLFAEDGWAFHAHQAGRWLLQLPDGTPPRTTSLEQALGMAIGPYLPQSQDNIPWHRALTEMQMLLHSCAFNREREGQGLPMVNGIWLWGAGYLPQAVACEWQALWGEGELLRGLAALHGIPVHAVPKDFPAWQAQAGEGRHWLQLSLGQGGDPEQTWFAPLIQALRRGELAGLQIDAANGRRWHVTPRQVRRWWRRRLNLSAVVA